MADKRRFSKAERQQKALEALITYPTVREAAKQSGLSETSLYRYLRDDSEFKEAYREKKREIMRGTSNMIQQTAQTAIQTLIDVMQDFEAPAASRVSAAKAILDMSYATHRDEDVYNEIEELREMVELIKQNEM